MNGQSCSTVLVVHFDSGPTVFALLVGAMGLPGGDKFFLPPSTGVLAPLLERTLELSG